MKFGNVEFNDKLMNALRDNNLAVFAGAGVSAPEPSNLPSFPTLLRRVKENFQVSRSYQENVDQFLGRLEVEGHDIRAYIVEQLTGCRPKPTAPRPVGHSTKGSDAKTGHHQLRPTVRGDGNRRGTPKSRDGLCAPALPSGGRFTGIVNLHGVIDQPQGMVLTDSDIGRAYLDERWALEFLHGLFRTQHVLFVGYSHQDPIVRYLARAMPTSNEPPWRFILTHELTVGNQSWNSLGIEPIVYQLGENQNHDEAAKAIAELAEYQTRSSSTWRQMIAETARQPNPPPDAKSQNIADRALQDPELTPAFTANAQNLSWIEWCIDRQYVVGAFDDSPVMENDLLLTWMARLLATHGPDEAIATITQAGRKLHPKLWWEITHRLLKDDHTRTYPTISRWVPYLLSAAPADLDTRKPDGLYRLALLCVKYELYEEVAHIFGELFRPIIRAQPLQNKPAQVELTTVGESWMLSDLWAGMAHHKETVSVTILDHAVQQIENRHRILQGWGLATAESDTDSSGRHLIGNSQGNYREAGIDQIVNIARDCLKWICQNEPELLEPWLDRLIASQSPLTRRLAVHTTRTRTDRSADEKVEWLFRNAVPMDSGRDLETEQLLIEEFKDLSEDYQQRIVEALRPDANEEETP